MTRAGSDAPALGGGADVPDLPRLHAVTDDALLAQPDWVERAVAVLEAGGPRVAVHVRGPKAVGAALYRIASELLPEARRTGGLLVVNDRVDVALALGLEGVHLAGRSLPLSAARRLLGNDRRIGVSVHDRESGAAAASGGADYVFLGTIFTTPSHEGDAGMGVRRFGELAASLTGLPVVGIGGIGPDVAGQVVAAGAHGVAAVRGIWGTQDPGVAVERYLAAIEGEREAEGR